MIHRGAGVARAVVVLLPFFVPVAGCHTIEGSYGVPPFFEVYDSPSSVREAVGREYYFRPLFSYETSTGKGTLTVADGKLIVLSEKGELLVAPAAPDGPRGTP